MPFNSKSYISFANRLNDFLGKLFAWLTLALVVIIFIVVVARSVFNEGSLMLQDSVNYLFAMMFMVGIGYTMRHDNHVRVDIFYNKMSERNKALVNLFGSIFFLIPFCIVIYWTSSDYVFKSWRILEGAKGTGGVPALFILKSFLLVMPTLLLIQGVANILIALDTIKNTKPGNTADQTDNSHEVEGN